MADIVHTGGSPSPNQRPGALLGQKDKTSLARMAERLGVKVESTGSDPDRPLKKDYIQALRTD